MLVIILIAALVLRFVRAQRAYRLHGRVVLLPLDEVGERLYLVHEVPLGLLRIKPSLRLRAHIITAAALRARYLNDAIDVLHLEFVELLSKYGLRALHLSHLEQVIGPLRTALVLAHLVVTDFYFGAGEPFNLLLDFSRFVRDTAGLGFR